MRFFNNRIVTKTVSLEEAVTKAKEPKPVRSLDEIIADIDAQNKQVKTAGSIKSTKTATKAPEAATKDPEAEKSRVEVKVAGIENIPEDKRAKPFGKKKDEDKETEKACGGKDEMTSKGHKKSASGRRSIKVAKKIDFRAWKSEDVVKAWSQHGSMEKCASNVKGMTSDPKQYCELLHAASEEAGKKLKKATSSLSIKVAKRIDFREWEAEDVVKAWSQHGSVEKCAANVKGMTDKPMEYCTLLHVASEEASKVLKQASRGKRAKTASKGKGKSKGKRKAGKGGAFKKIAKLTDKEHAWLAKYWAMIYGQDYVTSLLEDY